MNYRFFLVFCCAQLLNAAEDTAKQLPPQRCNAQRPQLSPLPEEAPARFDGQDPEQRQLSPRDTLDLRYAVDALQLPEGRSQSPVNEQPEKVSMSTIRESIKDLQKAVGGPFELKLVSKPGSSNDQNEDYPK